MVSGKLDAAFGQVRIAITPTEDHIVAEKSDSSPPVYEAQVREFNLRAGASAIQSAGFIWHPSFSLFSVFQQEMQHRASRIPG